MQTHSKIPAKSRIVIICLFTFRLPFPFQLFVFFFVKFAKNRFFPPLDHSRCPPHHHNHHHHHRHAIILAAFMFCLLSSTCFYLFFLLSRALFALCVEKLIMFGKFFDFLFVFFPLIPPGLLDSVLMPLLRFVPRQSCKCFFFFGFSKRKKKK